MLNKTIQLIIRHKERIIVFFLFVMSVLYYLPRFLMTGIPHYFYEDTWFHLNRLAGMGNVWRSPVNFLSFAHHGSLVNIFYPWLTMYPMYLIYKICGDYVLAYKLFYLLLTVITMFIAYYVMLEISESQFGAFIFAVLYTYSGYRFINIFRRAHIGEAVAMTAMLLVLLGLYQISFGNRRRWGALTAGMTLIAYSHHLALMIAAAVCGFYILLSIRLWNNIKDRILSFCKAAGMSLLLSLGLYIPILQYSRTNELFIPGGSGQGLSDSAHSLWEIIVKSLKNDPVSFSVGFWVVISLICLVLFYLRNAAAGCKIRQKKECDCFAVVGMIIFLASTSLLPWKWIGDHTPLYIIQFVWRLNVHSTLFILAAFSFCIPNMIRNDKCRFIFLVLICLLSLGLHYSAILQLHKEEETRILEADITSVPFSVYDYSPIQGKLYRSSHDGYTMGNDVYLDGNEIQAETKISEDGSVITVLLDTPVSDEEHCLADIPVFWYRSQRCLINGAEAESVMSDRGGSMVRIRSGEKNEISFTYHHSFLTHGSRIVSAIAAILFLLFYFGSFRKKT